MAEKIGDVSSASVKMILEPDKEKLFHFLGFTHPHEWKSDISNVSVLNNSYIGGDDKFRYRLIISDDDLRAEEKLRNRPRFSVLLFSNSIITNFEILNFIKN